MSHNPRFMLSMANFRRVVFLSSNIDIKADHESSGKLLSTSANI